MASPTIFSYSLLDSLGVITETKVFTSYDSATETVQALEGAWAEVGGDLDAVTNAQIRGGHILVPAAPDGGWKDAPVALSKNQDVAIVNMGNTFTRYATEVVIPAYIAALISNGAINLAQTDLAALTARLISTAGTVFYQSEGGAQLDRVLDGFLTGRKPRNLRRRTRRTP